MKFKILGLFLIGIISLCNSATAQGPPITADKPIMLGSGSVVIKTLSETMSTDIGSFTKVPIMVHYLPTSNSLIAVHLPYVKSNYNSDGHHFEEANGLGDIYLLGKYQFFRKDATAKTLRMVFKTLQTLPTGAQLPMDEISGGTYQGYYAWVVGYETIKYGISGEVGYNWHPSGNLDDLRVKLGFGLPLLKPTYPVNQINLFFEYASEWSPEIDRYQMLYAQGIQYAKGRLTVEAAMQIPLIQHNFTGVKMKRNLLLGTRYIF